MTAPWKAPSPAVRQTPATSAQAALWLLHQLDPESAAHNLCRCFSISGELRLDALQAAWRAVLERHPSLRTTLVNEDGQIRQHVGGYAADSVSFRDLAYLGAAADSSAARMCAEQAAQPFDLGRGPLARMVILALGSQQHRVLFVAHQGVADERSMSLLVEEISAGYASAIGANGPASSRAPRLASDVEPGAAPPPRRDLLDWWTATLAGHLPALELPLDRNRPVGAASGAGVIGLDWGQHLSRGVAELCRAERAHPRAVLLAAFEVLLHRYSGEDRIVLGMPSTTRRPWSDQLIGAYGNLVVLSNEIEPATTFRQLVAAADRTIQEALDYRELPFAGVVRVVNPDRDPRRSPLCDAMFSSSDEPASQLAIAATQVSELSVDNGSTTSDLSLRVDQFAPSLTGSLKYRSALFERASAERMVEQLHTVLAAAVEQPDLAVAALPLDGPDRRCAVERAADQLRAAVAADLPIHLMVARCAERHPEAMAVVTAGGGLTYRQLQDEVDRIAAHLRALGGMRASAVAVRMTPGPLQVAASLAVLQAGGHLVWFGVGDAGERSRAVLTDLRPRCLLLDGQPQDDELAGWYVDVLRGSVLDLSALTDPGAGHDGSQSAESPPAEAELDQWAYVAYTSGSTGRPKGIPQSHGAFAQFITWMAEEFWIRPGCRIAQWAAPEHDPSICEVFATLAAGATLYPVPERIRAHPEKLVKWLEDERITFLQTVPSFARELLKVISSTGAASRLSLQHLLLMGEALPAELANGLRAALPSIQLANVYGPTETIAATWHRITGPVHGATPIGRVIPGRQLLVLDESDRPCPAGVTGEIVIRSPYVTPGYVGASASDQSAFRAVPGVDATPGVRSYRSGDLARWRWDGELEFRGRRDFQVKLYGTRVELSDIEAALAEHESVTECAVVAITDQDGLVTRLAAYVVPRRLGPGQEPVPAEVWRNHLRRRFGTSMLPASFTVLTDRLPRNIGGKVDRRRLPSPQSATADGIGRPLTLIEQEMAEIWSELLGVDQIGADETFFTAGGHSLLMPQLVHRVRERFGVSIPLWECFAHPSLAAISALVDAAAGDGRLTPHPDPADRVHRPVPAQAN